MENISCIILAAGKGLRFKAQKQFIKWKGKELWEFPYEQCKNITDDITVVGVDIPGGITRQKSVYNGLCNIKNKRVVILESARPLVTKEQIQKIGNIKYDSVSYAIPSTDTIIYKAKIIDRKYTYRLQVPQAFDKEKLIIAHEKTKIKDPTDDTILMTECYGIEPKLIEGGFNLFKVTYPEDLDYLEVIKRRL